MARGPHLQSWTVVPEDLSSASSRRRRLLGEASNDGGFSGAVQAITCTAQSHCFKSKSSSQTFPSARDLLSSSNRQPLRPAVSTEMPGPIVELKETFLT